MKMRRLTHNLLFRAAAGIFFFLFFASFTVSAFLFGTIIYRGFYVSSEEEIVSQSFEDITEANCYRVAKAYAEGADIEQNEKIRAFDFEICDSSGEVIVSTIDEDSEYVTGYSVKKYPIYDIEEFFVSPGNVSGSDTYVGYITVSGYQRSDYGESVNRYYISERAMHILYSARHIIPLSVIALFAVSASLYIFLLASAGHRKGTDEIVLTPFGRIPFDVYTVLGGIIAGAIIVFFVSASEMIANSLVSLILAATSVIALSIPALLYSMGTAARIKKGGILRDMLICRMVRGISSVVNKTVAFLASALPAVWKAAMLTLLFFFAEFIIIMMLCSSEAFLMIWIVKSIAVFAVVIRRVYSLNILRCSIEKISDGDMSVKVPSAQMNGELRRIGEAVNGIGDVVKASVESAKKSERFKAELITNVSHDIKTPLTSIISYTDLIRRDIAARGETDGSDDQLSEYSEVLSRQADRLKRLLEDLIEASKASTGNLKAELVPMELGVMLSQLAGEWEDRLRSGGLELILCSPDIQMNIFADVKYICRVFDNLFNNICKYAQPATRVYLTLERKEDFAAVSLKNISKNPLSPNGEDYTERFRRGDASRGTDGNGLGLSIAKSLVELQGGEMRVSTDGDLFKVCLKFKTY